MSAEVFSGMLGVTMSSVAGAKGADEMVFVAEDGSRFLFYHESDCCESVLIEDVAGELADLVGSPITMAEMVSNESDHEPKPSEYSESWTWTFYKFGTAKGAVTVRWLGESNGYYSESVSFRHDPR